jgi:hypothetical protein
MSSKVNSASASRSAFLADNCINGNTEESSDSNMCMTGKEDVPWLALDFGQQVDVRHVTIYNRKDGTGGERFRNAEVRVMDHLPTNGPEMFTGGHLLGTFQGPATNGQVIQIQGKEYLQGRYTWIQYYQ